MATRCAMPVGCSLCALVMSVIERIRARNRTRLVNRRKRLRARAAPGVTAALGWRDRCNFKTRKQNKRRSCAAKEDETACKATQNGQKRQNRNIEKT